MNAAVCAICNRAAGSAAKPCGQRGRALQTDELFLRPFAIKIAPKAVDPPVCLSALDLARKPVIAEHPLYDARTILLCDEQGLAYIIEQRRLAVSSAPPAMVLPCASATHAMIARDQRASCHPNLNRRPIGKLSRYPELGDPHLLDAPRRSGRPPRLVGRTERLVGRFRGRTTEQFHAGGPPATRAKCMLSSELDLHVPSRIPHQKQPCTIKCSSASNDFGFRRHPEPRRLALLELPPSAATDRKSARRG